MKNIKKNTEKVLDSIITFWSQPNFKGSFATGEVCTNNKSLIYKEEFYETVNDMNIFPCIHKTIECNDIPQKITNQVFLRDGTKRSGVPDQLSEAERRIAEASDPCANVEQTNSDFNDYLTMFKHELRIPLSGISMGIYLLKNNQNSDDDKNILDNMNENLVFIEDIFSKFAVIQDGNIEFNAFEPFSIHILFEKIKQYLYCYIKSSEIEMDIYISTEIYDWNYGDKHNIQHCVINLLKNAIKHRDLSHKTIIHIEVKKKIHEIITSHVQHKPHVQSPSAVIKFKRSSQNIKKKQTILIIITDNNQKILQDNKTKLFTTFDSTNGSGLGLYMCKMIVELHGGTIDHEFIEPQGNKFIITLTLDLCEDVMLQISTHLNGTKFNKNMVSENVSVNMVEKAKFNVLLVDDNLLTRKLMYTVLRSIHIFKHVYTATDGADAIHKIKTYIKTLNIVFLDKNMPIMDGLHTAKSLRDMSFNQLIFGLTGEEDEISTFIECGVDYVIVKPLNAFKKSLIEKFVEKYGTHRPENKIIKKVHNVLEWVVQVKNNQNSDTFIKI